MGLLVLRQNILREFAGIGGQPRMPKQRVNWIGPQSVRRTFLPLADETGVARGPIRSIVRAQANELEVPAALHAGWRKRWRAFMRRCLCSMTASPMRVAGACAMKQRNSTLAGRTKA